MAQVPEVPKTTTVQEPRIRQKPRRKFTPLWYVILHDDQLHTYDYVIKMLTDVIKLPSAAALAHAFEVDREGCTIVARLAKDEAILKRDQIMSYGGDPVLKSATSMTASIEPCDD